MSTCISDVYLHAITQGNFSNGQRGGGEGTLHIKGTLVYTGEWRNGEVHGQGVSHLADGMKSVPC